MSWFSRKLASVYLAEYRGEMQRREWTPSTRARYAKELERFLRFVGDKPPRKISVADCRAFFDTFDNHQPSTIALENTIVAGFFAWLVDDDVLSVSPMAKVKRPKTVPLRNRKRTRITTDQVQEMLAACETWPETMCLNVLAYTGSRRHAVSELRWRDVDLVNNKIRFHEKGRKTISKPIAAELGIVFARYAAEHPMPEPDAFVIPNRRPTGRSERSDRIIWHLVKAVALRCEIKAHVHAFRAAFAVHFLTTNPNQLEACRALLGHESISTTQGYLDGLNEDELMGIVAQLSFGAAEADAA